MERSSHRFCLRPVGDQRQATLEHSLDISVDGLGRDFEDVFGNRATILEVTTPFQEMTISSRSVLRVEGVLASDLKSPLRRDQIPLVWMPWRRQMMQAYLMPPELPKPGLRLGEGPIGLPSESIDELTTIRRARSGPARRVGNRPPSAPGSRGTRARPVRSRCPPDRREP